jgi:hypothetical protein
MGEHGRPILGDVFVEQDARFGLAQQPRQRCLPVQEWEIAQLQELTFWCSASKVGA